MKAALTDILLRSLKPPAKGRLEIADIKCAGLEFRLTAGGVRSWSFRFRDPATGLPARSTIGRYPQFSLAEARQAVNALRNKWRTASIPCAPSVRSASKPKPAHSARSPNAIWMNMRGAKTDLEPLT